MAQSFLDQPGLSRGLRNNNPGNLVATAQKWQGELTPDRPFARFSNVAWGLRAMITDILGDIVVDGYNTIRKLITIYAPPTENDTAAYIRTVSSATEWGADKIIDPTRTNIEKLIRAQLPVEIGPADATKISSGDFSQAFSLLSTQVAGWLSKSKTPRGGAILGMTLMTVAVFSIANLSNTKGRN